MMPTVRLKVLIILWIFMFVLIHRAVGTPNPTAITNGIVARYFTALRSDSFYY